MTNPSPRKLKVFLCHSSGDKAAVRNLYNKLSAESCLDVWLDEKNLQPGQEWEIEIPKAVKQSDVVIVCLSKKSITKEGYVQKETKIALDIAEEKPVGTTFIIPLRLNKCDVPIRLSKWQYVDYFAQIRKRTAYQSLLKSLNDRARSLGISCQDPPPVPINKYIVILITVFLAAISLWAVKNFWTNKFATNPEPTLKASPTPTLTFTPTYTQLPTLTSTITETPTPSRTPTITLTSTDTITPTNTLTPTPAPVLSIGTGGCGKFSSGIQCWVRVGISWIPVDKKNKVCVYVQSPSGRLYFQTDISYFPNRSGYTVTAYIGDGKTPLGQTFTIHVVEMPACNGGLNGPQKESVTITR